jgi:hypothetical protein
MKWIITNHYNRYLGTKNWEDIQKDYPVKCEEINSIIEINNEGNFTYLIPIIRNYFILTFEDDEIICEHEDLQVLKFILLPRLHFSKIEVVDSKTKYKELHLFSEKLNCWIKTRLYII